LRHQDKRPDALTGLPIDPPALMRAACLSSFVVSVEGLVAIELRKATLSDASAIRDLTRRAYAKWVPLLGREPMPMTADYDVAVRQHRFDLLVSHDSLAALI
jgi:hypothetical protein